jgi:hypothetical protein
VWVRTRSLRWNVERQAATFARFARTGGREPVHTFVAAVPQGTANSLRAVVSDISTTQSETSSHLSYDPSVLWPHAEGIHLVVETVHLADETFVVWQYRDEHPAHGLSLIIS